MPLTPEQYLEIERQADFKSEYYQGEMIAMPLFREAHVLTSGNALAELHQQLRRRREKVYSSNMRVLVTPSDLFTYPDVTVVSGHEEFLDRELDTLLNPTLIIEVLSNTTEGYDRGLKFKLYRALPSLKQYLLISSQYVGVDLFTRDADGQWLLTSKDNLDDTVHLTSIDCGLKLADLYEKVDFTA